MTCECLLSRKEGVEPGLEFSGYRGTQIREVRVSLYTEWSTLCTFAQR